MAGQAAVDLETLGLDLADAVHGDGGATGGAVELDAVLAEGFEQRPDRAFLHVVIAVQHHGAFNGGHGGGEEAHGGAGVAEEQRLRRQLQFA